MGSHNHYTPIENLEIKKRVSDITISSLRAYTHLASEYKKLDDSFGELQKENEELKCKLEICEGYLKKVYECDMCIHAKRSEAEVEL